MNNIFSVSDVNRMIRNMFKDEYILQNIEIKGEVSNCKYNQSGHIYFSLKDENSLINCIMFAGNRRGLSFPMKNGDKVVVRGNIDVYEVNGTYRLLARLITKEGMGEQYERYLRLKQELEDMGMFAEEYKQPIPKYIKTLGLVTSPTNSVIHDVCSVAYKNNPYIQIVLFPVKVQGTDSAQMIARGIQKLDEYGVDTIIICRGGGSDEERCAFNSEMVARAIFECRTPVISAVGHQDNFMIADLVADARASTPTKAASMAVFDLSETLSQMEALADRMNLAIDSRLRILRGQYQMHWNRLQYLSPQNQLQENFRKLSELQSDFQKNMKQKMAEYRKTFLFMADRYQGLSPLRKLSQGFSYVTDEDRKTVTDIHQVQPGNLLHIAVTNGEINARVESVREETRIHE
ncbi:MAG: exodeoxyribonuclease VII large subunit [Eubacteriales bacterium]|nr:exodeoxyribonuclease VII large subunit [Eubacteriales bacterium]